MKQTLLTLALTAALLPATFARSSQTTTHNEQHSSSSTTVTDPASTPPVDSVHRERSSSTETKAKYGKHGSKVQTKRESSSSVSHNGDADTGTGVTRRRYDSSSSSSSTTTNVPPTTTTTTTTSPK